MGLELVVCFRIGVSTGKEMVLVPNNNASSGINKTGYREGVKCIKECLRTGDVISGCRIQVLVLASEV